MNNKFNFHSRIEFYVLRKTEKAILISIEKVGNDSVVDLLNEYGHEVIEPLEMWIPKSWIRFDENKNPWVWTEGFVKNLNKLIQKRLANLDIRDRATKINMDEIIPEGVTIH